MADEDCLPRVSEDTLKKFLREFNYHRANTSPEITEKIYLENPYILRVIRPSMIEAPNPEARAYIEQGMQITYELLRRQALADKEALSKPPEEPKLLEEDKGFKAFLATISDERAHQQDRSSEADK